MDERPLIVVGFDGSDGAARAIAGAATLMPDAEALVVCVYRPVLPEAGAALLGDGRAPRLADDPRHR
jgi:nucleotide-binding universal stress UspA family protein